jgi:hypothetical protein
MVFLVTAALWVYLISDVRPVKFMEAPGLRSSPATTRRKSASEPRPRSRDRQNKNSRPKYTFNSASCCSTRKVTEPVCRKPAR